MSVFMNVGLCVSFSSLLFLHLLLLLVLPTAALQKVASEQPIKEDYIHGCHDSHTYTAKCVCQEGHLVPVEHQPAGHPGQRVDAEHHICAQVHHAVDSVQCSCGNVGHTQNLSEVEEHRVYLHQQSHHSKPHITARQDREAKTSDHLQEKTTREKVREDVAQQMPGC